MIHSELPYVFTSSSQISCLTIFRLKYCIVVLARKQGFPVRNFVSFVDRRSNRNCTEALLNNCQEQFNKSPIQICGKAPRLRACLEPCRVVKSWPSWVARVTYESLVKKIQDCDEERVFCGVSSQGIFYNLCKVWYDIITHERDWLFKIQRQLVQL